MKAQGIGICEWALPTPLRGPLVCRVLKDLGLAAVELKLGTVEKNFPLANRYTLDLYKEEPAKYGTVFTGIAVNLTDFYAMTAPLGSSDREIVEHALRTAVDAAHDPRPLATRPEERGQDRRRPEEHRRDAAPPARIGRP